MAEYQFTLEPFSPAVLAAYRAFPAVLDQSGDKIAWKLERCPFGPGLAMVVRDEAGAIVGMNIYQAVTIRNGKGPTLTGHQSMDTVVSEAARGQGLFTRMYRAYYDQTDADFVFGFPNRNSAHGFFGKLGWSNFGTVPMRIRPLRTGFIAKRLGLRALDFPVPRFRAAKGSSTELASFDETHTAVWRDTLRQAQDLWGVDRCSEFLNWRYRDHPVYNYRLLGRPDGSFIVTTIQDKHGARILYVMEALGNPGTVTDMLREVHGIAAREGAELVLAWSSESSPLAGAFRAAGYRHFPDRLRTNEIKFGARRFKQAEAPRGRDDWFVTYSDSDTV